MRLPFALLAVTIGALSSAASARTPPATDPADAHWQIIGPGGGGTTRHPTISPIDPRHVLVACDMTGAYVTDNGGESWRMFNLGTDVDAFAFDPSNPDVMYAGTAALWQSRDRGHTWRMLFPDPAKNTRELMIGDHADYVLQSDDPLYARPGQRMSVQAIAVDPRGAVTIAVSGGRVFRGSADGGFIVTSGDGKTWKLVRSLPPEGVLALSIDTAGRVAVVTESHVFRQTATGWDEHPGPSSGTIHSAGLGFDPDGHVAVLAATGAAERNPQMDILWASKDGGATWEDVRRGPLSPGEIGKPPRFRAVTMSTQHAGVAYAGFEELRLADGELYNGIARTGDNGRTWTVVHREGRSPSPTLEGSWVEQRAIHPGPDIWFDAPYDITVSPVDPDIVYVTDLFRTYRTLDGGLHWTQVHSRQAGTNAWISRGLDVTTNYGIHVDAHDRSRIFMSNTDMGLFRSEDGGQSWIPSSEGMPQNWRNTTYWVVFDPDESGLMWGAFSGTHDLPRPKMWRSRDPDRYRGGVGISHDGGHSWTAAPGLPLGAVTHILLDPASPRGHRTLYACLFGRGVFKSVDGGASWTQKNDGLPAHQPFAWRIVAGDGGRLYLILSRRSEDGRIGDEGDGALFVSDDGADHWQRVPLPDGTNGPTGLLIDPADSARLYLSAWGRYRPDGDIGGGVFLSTDRGRTWRAIETEHQHVYDVTMDPRTGVLYICGFDQGAWRSTDRGTTWQRLKGYDFKWGHRVVPDPASPDLVYVTTYGGGVWHGPAAGDPDAQDTVIVPARP